MDKMIIFEPTRTEEIAVQNYVSDLIEEQIELVLSKYK